MLTRSELDDFHEFTAAKIENGGVASLDESLRQWRERQEYQESVAALREAQAEVAAGQTLPAHVAEAELRAKFNLRPREVVR